MCFKRVNECAKGVFSFVADVFNRFTGDRITTLAASLSFLAIFSFGPLAVLVTLILEALFKSQNTQAILLQQVQNYGGSSAVDLMISFISYFHNMNHNTLITLASIVILLVTAVGFFSNIRDSLNAIFGLDKKPSIKKHIVKSLVSMALIFGIVILLIISVLFNTITVKIDNILAQESYLSLYILSPLYFIASVFVIALMFAAVYHMLPDRNVRWYYLFSGSVIASLLFIAGKTLFEWYMGTVSYSSLYGTAGSIMVVMLWVYYSMIIFYLGAVFARSHEEIAKRIRN